MDLRSWAAPALAALRLCAGLVYDFDILGTFTTTTRKVLRQALTSEQHVALDHAKRDRITCYLLAHMFGRYLVDIAKVRHAACSMQHAPVGATNIVSHADAWHAMASACYHLRPLARGSLPLLQAAGSAPRKCCNPTRQAPPPPPCMCVPYMATTHTWPSRDVHLYCTVHLSLRWTT